MLLVETFVISIIDSMDATKRFIEYWSQANVLLHMSGAWLIHLIPTTKNIKKLRLEMVEAQKICAVYITFSSPLISFRLLNIFLKNSLISINTGRSWDWWWSPRHQVDRKMPWSSETSWFWGRLQSCSLFWICLNECTRDSIYDWLKCVIPFSLSYRLYGRKILQWTQMCHGTCLWTQVAYRWVVSV